jgi:hypothetical protein
MQSGGYLDTEANVLSLIEPKPKNGQPSASFRFSSYDLKTTRLSRTTGWMGWDRIKPGSGQLYLAKVPNKPSHFLVMAEGTDGTARSAILNVDAGTILDIPNVFLVPTPDGSGFLAQNLPAMNTWQDSLKGMKKLEPQVIEKLCEESLSFVDLDGKQLRLAWDKSSIGRAIAHYEKQWNKASTSTRPGNDTYEDLIPIQWLDWLGGVSKKQKPTDTMTVLVGQGRGAIQIDLKQRTVTELVGPAAPNANASSAFSASTATKPLDLLVKLRDVEYRTRVLEYPTRKAPYHVASLEARWPIERRTKTLLDRVQVDGLPTCDKTSPNGRYAVVKYEEPKKEKNEKRLRIHYVIVDHGGNTVDSLLFEHLDRDQFTVEPLFPDDLAEKQK